MTTALIAELNSLTTYFENREAYAATKIAIEAKVTEFRTKLLEEAGVAPENFPYTSYPSEGLKKVITEMLKESPVRYDPVTGKPEAPARVYVSMYPTLAFMAGFRALFRDSDKEEHAICPEVSIPVEDVRCYLDKRKDLG